MLAKINCWEFEHCGRESGGSHVDELGVCPANREAYADGLNDGKNGGRICWTIAGTFCGGTVQGTFAEKRFSCLSCEFYKLVKKEEGNAEFTLMKPDQL